MNALVTGMGILSAIGPNVAATRIGLFAPPPLPALPTRFPTTLPNPVFELPAAAIPDTPDLSITDRILFAALSEALASAGLDEANLARFRIGVAMGTTVAVQLNDIPFYTELATHPDAKGLSNKPVLRYLAGCPADAIRARYRLNGPALTISNACSSGADAIAVAGLWLEQGLCDIVIAGGADEVNRVPYIGFNSLGVCAHEPCRPFDAARTGLNLGEAAGVLILERPDSARRRGRRAACSLAGIGKTSDAHHITQPCQDGREFERAIRLALSGAAIEAPAITFVNAHGTGTLANDSTEAAVLGRVFGPGVKFMSTKAVTGHTLGAAGAIEAIFTCLMLEAGRAARSYRFQTKPADMPVAPLTDDAPVDGRYALSTSLAFGGSNTALVFRKEEP